MAKIYLSDVPGQDDYPEGYWENRRKHAPVKPRYKRTTKDDEYWAKKNKQNEEAAKELNRSKGVIMSHLSDIATDTPFTGNEYIDTAESQRQQKINKWHDIRNGMEAAAVVGENIAAGYGILRGLAHLRRLSLRAATRSTGNAISREAMTNLSKWNRLVNKVDAPQATMNGIGATVDGYQWITADNRFDRWENALETGANTAGFVGGMNWFRNLPVLRRIGGETIDNVLDGLGYGAATWDVVKQLPPLSGVLENFREQSKQKENK